MNRNLKLLFILAILWQTLLYLRLPSFVWDDAFVIPWFLKNGLKFYVDFSGGYYFPLPKLLMVFYGEITNWSMRANIFLGFMEVLSAIAVIYWMSLKYLRGQARYLPLLFFTILFGFILKQNTFEINLFLGILSLIQLAILMSWFENGRLSKSFLLGFVGGISIFSQQMTAVTVGIFFTTSVIYSFLNRKKYVLFGTVITYLLGVAAVGLPICLWFFTQGLWSEFVHYNVGYYLEGTYPFNKGFNTQDMLLLSIVNIPLLLLTARVFLNKKFEWIDIVIFGFLSSSLVLTLIAVMHPRRFLLVLPIACFAIGREYGFFKKTKSSFNKNFAIFLFIIFGFYSMTKIIPWYTNNIIKGRQHEIYNAHHPGDNVYEAIEWIKNNTKKEDRIFSFETMIAYYEMDRLPALNRTYILPWAFEPFDEFYKEWETKKPKYAFVSELMFGRFEQLGYAEKIKPLRMILDNDYEKRATFNWMSVYVRK